MYCKNCGKQLPDGAQYCDGCGARQVAGGYVTYTQSREPKPSVGFIDAIKLFFTKYADFSTRSRRSEYWFGAVLRPCQQPGRRDSEGLCLDLVPGGSDPHDRHQCPPSARHRKSRHLVSAEPDPRGGLHHSARLVLPGQHRRQPVGSQSQVLIFRHSKQAQWDSPLCLFLCNLMDSPPLPLPMGEVAERSEDGEGIPGCNTLSVTFGDSSPKGRRGGCTPHWKWSVSFITAPAGHDENRARNQGKPLTSCPVILRTFREKGVLRQFRFTHSSSGFPPAS